MPVGPPSAPGDASAPGAIAASGLAAFASPGRLASACSRCSSPASVEISAASDASAPPSADVDGQGGQVDPDLTVGGDAPPPPHATTEDAVRRIAQRTGISFARTRREGYSSRPSPPLGGAGPDVPGAAGDADATLGLAGVADDGADAARARVGARARARPLVDGARRARHGRGRGGGLEAAGQRTLVDAGPAVVRARRAGARLDAEVRLRAA